ncbi:cytochrome P450 71A1-like [Selaginella moellendorffii]|uniref:cytochrome P450 71A1-like n=1 Tax=Selaginella moellendorffii TaxID=88036 RepID=UPI000D1CDC9A|nr:cytochrome P450 71A1-like [Selaginella moellendorffii]|eukprot:XP_024542442.1 cytochrome P450 71A1-like [Selaginella moellendorffii]
MELLQLVLVGLLSLVLYKLVGILLFKNNGSRPPSPGFCVPILGHLPLLGNLPHISLLNLSRKFGGLMHLKLGQVDTLVISCPDAARELLKFQDIATSSRPAISSARYFGYGGAGLAWAPYGEHWRSIRKLCTLELLTAKRVEFFQPIRKQETRIFLRELLAMAEEGREVDLSTMIKDVTFNTIAKMVMSKSYSAGSATSKEEMEEALFFNRAITRAFELGGSMHIGDFVPWLGWMDTQVAKIEEVQHRIDLFLQKEIDTHRKNFGGQPKDFIDLMMSTGELTDASLKAVSLDMIAAGTDTSAVLIEWAMAELIKNPEFMDKARKELKQVIGDGKLMEDEDISRLEFLQAIVKETFRLHPPVPLLLPHESIESFRAGGYTFPARTRILINAYAIGRDKSTWRDASRFDPDRFLGSCVDVKGQHFELLPFGAGRRGCPGIHLGLTTVYYILGNLVHAFDWICPRCLV